MSVIPKLRVRTHSRPNGPESMTRPADTAQGSLSDRLRDARVSALLTGAQGRHESAGSELESLLARVAEIYSKAISEETRVTYARRWLLFCDVNPLEERVPSAEGQLWEVQFADGHWMLARTPDLTSLGTGSDQPGPA